MPTAQAILFCTSTDVEGLLSALGVLSRLDDDQSGVVDVEEDVRMDQALQYATAKVRFYCEVHYTSEALATSWLVNDWATIIASFWLSIRRGNTPTDALKELYAGADGKGGALGDMKLVRERKMYIPGCVSRHSDAPFLDNYRNDARYRFHQSRLQQSTSDKAPPEGRSQRTDVADTFTLEN